MTEKTIIHIRENSIKEFTEYLAEREHAEATIRKYITDVRTFLEFQGENRQICKSCLLEYKAWIMERYTVSSVNSMLAALNQFLVFLGGECLKIRQIKVQKNLFLQEEKEMTQNEYQRLVKAAKEKGKIQLALCMETIAVTGIRISELKFFTVERVRRGRIEIFNKGKYRRIFLSKDIRKKLLLFAGRYKIRKGCIFITRNGKPKDRSNIWSEMKALKKEAGVSASKIFPHNLRHLFARNYYRCAKDLAGLADLLGHSSINVTRIYTATAGAVYQRQLDRMTVLRI